MQDGSSRRRLLQAGVLGTLAGLGGCLRLSNDDATTDGTATDADAPTTAATTTDATAEGGDPETETETDSDPESRDISGPSTVDHAFVDPRNRMAQPTAAAPATAPVVDWEQGIEGGMNARGFTGPLVTSNAIVVPTFRDVGAYSRRDGSVMWRLSESGVGDYGPATQPDHRDDAIVFAARNGRTRDWELVAVEAADATKRWSVTLPVESEEQVRATVVDGSRAVVVTGSLDDASTQYADAVVVDLESRSVSYESRLADAQLNPEDVAVDGPTLVVTTDEAASGMDNVVAFDLERRERLWSRSLSIGEAIPVLGDDDVYLPTETDGRDAAVRAFSRADGSERWQFELRRAPRTGVTVAHDRVYAVSNETLYALNASDGTPAWSFTRDEGASLTGGSSGLPVATSDHLLLGSDFAPDGGGGVIRAVTRADGDLAWTRELPDEEVFSPFVVDDHLYSFSRDDEDDAGTIYALH